MYGYGVFGELIGAKDFKFQLELLILFLVYKYRRLKVVVIHRFIFYVRCCQTDRVFQPDPNILNYLFIFDIAEPINTWGKNKNKNVPQFTEINTFSKDDL